MRANLSPWAEAPKGRVERVLLGAGMDSLREFLVGESPTLP
jgi:hypothetical protein